LAQSQYPALNDPNFLSAASAATVAQSEQLSSAMEALDTSIGTLDLASSALACEAGACLGVWQGANQNWYSQNWGGNGATGARLSVLEDTAFFENLGTTLFFGTTLLNLAAFAGNVNTGNTLPKGVCQIKPGIESTFSDHFRCPKRISLYRRLTRGGSDA
jgi:hypothetical protein